ncbi:hypothetical protein ACHAWC_005764 [Mediolabrus comicus]
MTSTKAYKYDTFPTPTTTEDDESTLVSSPHSGTTGDGMEKETATGVLSPWKKIGGGILLSVGLTTTIVARASQLIVRSLRGNFDGVDKYRRGYCKDVSVEDIHKSQEKRIKTFTCVHRGRLNFNFLLRVVFYFLLANTAQATSTTSKDDFAWTSSSNLDYKDYCDVFGGSEEWSCLCLTGTNYVMNEGKHSYFICDSKCDRLAYKVSGYCAQCAAGEFWGNYYSENESGYEISNAKCPSHDTDTCTCGTLTRSPAPGSDNTKYYFEYVCSHKADKSQKPNNQVGYNNDIGNSQSGKCSTCPAGTYSEQGDMVCKPCEAGRYSSSDGSSECTPCPAGQYSDDTGFTSCKVCDAGTFSNAGKDASGSTRCNSCAPGYYSSSSGSSECTKCPAGHYTNFYSGATECTAASPGFYVGATNDFSPHLVQYECPIGSYSETTGQPHCTSCPFNTSTYDTGSTSLSDCIPCPNGVDANTFACITTPSNQLNNVCWNAGQLLSLGASSAIADLYNLVYNLPDVGINALISDAMSVIQGAVEGTSSIKDIQAVLDKLKNAEENWLGGLSDNFDSCVASMSTEIINVAKSDVQYNTNLFQYQFGDNYALTRAEWIAQWRCKGATFGCTSFDTSCCPQAQTCFDPLYKYFGPFLSYAGGTVFGNYQHLIAGRYTPMYSPSFISQQLGDNVNSLIQWVNAATSFQRYYDIMNQIQDSEQFTADAINAVLQVQAVSTSVSLDSSYTEGNLYYEQGQYNYNKTFDIAQIVQYGPASCQSGYEITADGIPNGCTDYATLVEECQREIRFDAAMKLISDTMKLAAGLVQPLPGTAKNWEILAFKGFNAVANLATESTTLLQQPWFHGSLWDPNTEMPTLPDLTADGSFTNAQYADASYQWYLDGQTNLSESLIAWSPARWDAIYLENEKQYGPTVLNPPNCPNHKSKIVAALNDYLINVQSMSNYGSSMTAALMSLVPAMGNIAAGIATQAAIVNANQEISGMVNTPNPSLGDTAPPEYQSVYEQLFFATYKDTSNAILAYAPSASLVQQQYVAAKSIFGFCTSYSYMNAGQDYVNTLNGQAANCRDFGSLYLPTNNTFKDTVNSFVYGNLNSISNPPSSVDQLNKNIIDFSKNIQNNPEAVGQTRQDVTGAKSFAIEFPLGINATAFCENGNTTSVKPYSPPQVYVDLTNGIVRFSLTASSDLLQQSKTPFNVKDANPLVINVQTYLKGVTTPDGQFIKMIINPIAPYFVYLDDSGVGTTYTLPSFKGSSGSSSFATFDSIQVQETCPGTDEKLVETNWMDGERLSFCTDYSLDLQAPFEGIAEYNFLFPNLFTTWEVQMNYGQSHICDTHLYTIVNETLTLQVVFQYVESTTPSPADPNTCYQNCYKYEGVLPGQLWCDQPKCGDCPASLSYNGTDLTNGTEFCRCNVWNGNNGICTPTLALSDTYAVSLSDGSSRRNLRKKNKKGSDMKGTKSDKDNGAKSGKSMSDEEMMTSQNLQEALQAYLRDCGGGDNLVTSQVLVEVYECHRHKKKNGHQCEFHVLFNEYEDDGDSKKALHECIDEKLQDEDILKDILQQTSSCGISVSVGDKSLDLAHHDGCDHSSETSIFERV